MSLVRFGLALVLAAGLALTLAACSSPPNQPCFYHEGIAKAYLTHDGRTLLTVCKDGTERVSHP